MLPTLLEIGPLSLHTYGLLLALGFLTGLFFVRRGSAKIGIEPDFVNDMGFWALLVALAGTRILHIIMYREDYSWSDPVGWIAVWRGGLVFQGAILPSILFCYWYLRRKGHSFWQFSDIACTFLPLGHAVGRLGCFMNGCCYGQRTELPWGIPFRRVPWDLEQVATGSPAFMDHCRRFGVSYSDHWSFPVHPTQLYSALGLVAISLLLMLLVKKWHPFTGFVMPLYFILYSGMRFFVESLRGDHNPTHFGDLSDQQVFSLLAIVAGVVLFLVLRALNKRSAAKE
jgi:phosphatidylglycerol---prolipoprotein diacylglyceryl transferase